MLWDWLFLALGLGALTLGAEGLIRGSSRLARAWGISPLAIGLTVVAFGTSTPELLVNIKSVVIQNYDIALGNVIGSNIFNILFILGLCGLLYPLKVVPKLVRFDVPVMIAVSLLLWVFAMDLRISRAEAGLFVVGLIAYTFFCFAIEKKVERDVVEEFDKEFGGDVSVLRHPRTVMLNLFLLSAGLVLLGFGAQWLVDSAVAIARWFKVSEFVIAATIIAAGTSLPEVATSVTATIKGERDIAIGNVVGSNIYNILMILGVSALIPANGFLIELKVLRIDIPFVVFVAAVCYPIFRDGMSITRLNGAFLFALYLGYTWYLIRQGAGL